VSDDCTIKFWDAHTQKVLSELQTETITCVCATGPKRDFLIAGCHSGNILVISATSRVKRETMPNSHYNLIRVVISLEALKNKFFVTGDVCGILKVWGSHARPSEIMTIEQEGALSYNSMVEVQGVLPNRVQYQESTIIACALKSSKVNLILIEPASESY